MLIHNRLGVIESLSHAINLIQWHLNWRPHARQWLTHHSPWSLRGGSTPLLARPIRPERALKHHAPTTPSTHPHSLPPTRSASPHHRIKLVKHHNSSAIAARHRRSSTGRFILATAAMPSPPPPRATNTTMLVAHHGPAIPLHCMPFFSLV